MTGVSPSLICPFGLAGPGYLCQLFLTSAFFLYPLGRWVGMSLMNRFYLLQNLVTQCQVDTGDIILQLLHRRGANDVGADKWA
jgi:hypothetical protein